MPKPKSQDPAIPADETSAADNPQDQTPAEEVYLGKYKTKEDAERGVKELERFAYDQSRQLADMKRQVEEMAAVQQQYAQNPYPAQYPGGYAPAGTVPGYQGYPMNPQAEMELQNFYQNPVEYLKRRDQQVEERAYKRAVGDVRVELTNRDIVTQWKSDNPDLVKHEPVVATFVAQQPAHLSVREKLDRAADDARRYLADVARQGRNQQAPRPDQVVEHPANATQGTQVVRPYQEPEDQESVLAEYVNEQRAWKDKRRLA